MLEEKYKKTKQIGASLIELIVAIAIFAIIASGVVVLALGSYRSLLISEKQFQLNEILSQSINAIESIRNQDWEGLLTGEFGLAFDGTSWSLVEPNNDSLTDPFSRKVIISPVLRNELSQIVDSGGIQDNNSKLITIEISDQQTISNLKTIQHTFLLTNWQISQAEIDINYVLPPVIESCSDYCIMENYESGTCRQNTNRCTQNNETPETGGDQYCLSNPNRTCCCL